MWFWEKNEPAYGSHEYEYANNPQYRKYYDNLQIIQSDGTLKYANDDKVFNAGNSFKEKLDKWADSMYEREDKILDTITETAKKAVGIGQNLALLGLAGAGILIYIKYFYKGGKK